MRIKLHIKCLTGDDDQARLRDLGVDTVEDTTEYRPFSLDPEMIIGFYPDKEGGCFVMVGDVELSISETFNEIDDMLNKIGL